MKLGERRPEGVETDHGMPLFLSIFRHRDYSLLVAGIMGTQLGSWVQTVAQGWLVYQITHSAFQLGLVGFIRGSALLIVSPFSGALADRFDRRRMLILATGLSALSGTILAILVGLHLIQVWQVYLTALIDGVANSSNLPVRQAMVYDAVEDRELTTAIAVQSLASNLMRVTGPVLGGVLIGYFSLSLAFFVQAAAYAADLLVTVFLHPQPPAGPRRAPFMESVRGGLIYIVRTPLLLRLTLLVVIPVLLVYPYVQFMPVFAEKVLHVGAQGYGFLNTAVGYGSLIGSVIVAVIGTVPRRGLVVLSGTLLYTLMVCVFSLMHAFEAAFAVLVLAGVANSIYLTLNQTLLQLNVEDAYRGRVLAVYAMASSLYPIGALGMGALIALIGAPHAVATLSLLATVLGVAMFVFSPQVREI